MEKNNAQTAKQTKQQCPDCGNAPVNHFVEKANAAIGELFQPIFSVKFSKSGSKSGSKIMSADMSAYFFKKLAAARLGVIIDEPDAVTRGRARCVWVEAKRRGIKMWEFRPFGVNKEIFVAEFPTETETKKSDTQKTIVFEGLPRPALTLSGKKGPPASLAWVDNKPILKKKLSAAGILVAQGGTAFTWKKARGIFGKMEKPVIVKPSTGSRSRHTTTGIIDETTLRIAYIKAKRLSPRIIIEQELAGMVYRGTVIGGKVVGIRRKDPPQVTGDGIHTLRELIDIENLRPERQGPVYGKIDIHTEINIALEKIKANTKIGTSDIPKKGQLIVLSDKTSIGSGGGSTDVTDIAHPDIVALLEKIAVTLDDPLVGADFIMSDITKSWRDRSANPRAGVIECNSLPFIDVHLFPLNGKVRDTAGALWDTVLGK